VTPATRPAADDGDGGGIPCEDAEDTWTHEVESYASGFGRTVLYSSDEVSRPFRPLFPVPTDAPIPDDDRTDRPQDHPS
jgi:hypothetical protein